jgi:hypothetical protein
MKKALAIVAGALLVVACASARPVQNIDPSRHPNLAAAQRLCAQAFDRVDAAQKANEWDMGGHAQKAKDILIHVNDELKEAALAANKERR